ncbi:MAG: aa3-type cytochrome c oxidase subunit IV [Novosphingobium sp.]|nr:aa3-type cytochrome c oxidase subunit IV [Novosphingobium sp.]
MATGKDMDTANETYGGFISLVKWGTILSAVAAVFVVGLIAS